MNVHEYKIQIDNMFKGMAKKQKKINKIPIIPDNNHKYFATFRRRGHTTIRVFLLGQGPDGQVFCRAFLDAAKDVCEYLMFYRIDAISGEITAFDPTK